jgi:ABC-type phosphate transport system substrate-binding protein
MELCKQNGIQYIELPICFDALTIAVNPKNDWVKSITVADLKKMWEPEAQGKITHWNQVRPEWPNEKLLLFGAGSDSGTFDYFTEAITGKAKASRGDYTGSEDDNVLVQGIEGNRYALGYIPFAYYAPNANRTWNPMEPAATITAFIVQVSLGDLPHGSIGYQSIFAAGLTLFVLTIIFNIAGYVLRRRFREVY